MDTKEMAQGYEENIKRAFDIIEKCKKQEKQLFGRKRNQKTLKRFFEILKMLFDLFVLISHLITSRFRFIHPLLYQNLHCHDQENIFCYAQYF